MLVSRGKIVRKNIVLIWLSIVFTVLVCLWALTLQVPANWPTTDISGFHTQLVMNLIVGTTHVTGAILFLINLDVYKAKLRRAYIILALGVTLAGVGTLQNTIITLLSWWDTPYGSSGLTMLPFLLSGFTLYIAIRAFARLVAVEYILTKFRIVIPVVVGLVLLSTLLPHMQAPNMTEATYDILVAITMWSGMFMVLAGLVNYKTQQSVGQHYRHAMKWLTRALFTSGAVLLYVGFFTLIDSGFDIVIYTFNGLTTVVSGLVWMRAGYAFALTKSSQEDLSLLKALFGLRRKEPKDYDSAIDMVTSAAGLVSNAQEIDPTLDKVRTVTSKLVPGESLSAEDTAKLIDAYLQIEQYLTTKEAIRTFTTEELRERLSPTLRQLVESHPKKV